MDEQSLAKIPEAYRTDDYKPLFDAHENYDSFMGDVLSKSLQTSSLSSEIESLKKSGEGLVKIPGEDATPEDIAAYRKAIGVPDSIDGYGAGDLNSIAGGKELMEAFLSVGMTKAQVDAQLKTLHSVEKARTAAETAAMEKAVADYRATLGDKADSVFQSAKEGVDTFFKDVDSKESISKMIMQNPALTGVFSQIGRLVKEKPGIMSFGSGGDRTGDIYESMKGLDD